MIKCTKCFFTVGTIVEGEFIYNGKSLCTEHYVEAMNR